MSAGSRTPGLLAAGTCIVLPLLSKYLQSLSLVSQLGLAAITYLVVTSELQRRSTAKFEVTTTSPTARPLPVSSSRSSNSTLKLPTSTVRDAESTSNHNLRAVEGDGSEDRLDYAEHVARIRDQQCPQLIEACYLDAAAAPPFPSGLVKQVTESLCSDLYSNPHSKSPSAIRTADAIDRIRTQVMKQIFGITETSDWHIIFTAGTTASLKLVGECFDWSRGSFWCLQESHTSLLGIRDLAASAGSTSQTFAESCPSSDNERNLIALPLQCNATGKRHVDLMRNICRSKGKSYVLIDAASYLSSSSRMDMSSLPAEEQPDFVAFSFYKIFGYPTGLGALLVKKSSTDTLANKIYHGGGTVDAILPESRWTKARKGFESRFEDGTVNIHGILAVGEALDYYQTTFGTYEQRKTYVQDLTAKMFQMLGRIKHANGRDVLRIYTTSDYVQSWLQGGKIRGSVDQGPILNFNILTADGKVVPPQEVGRLASVSNIHLRMGRHCNAGFVVYQLGATEDQLKEEYANGIGCDESGDSDTVSTSLRVSLCLLNTVEDLERLGSFIRRFFRNTSMEGGSALLNTKVVGADESRSSFRLDTITIYPIKSCAGQDLQPSQRWQLTPHGLEFDREWIVMDLRNGKGLSQKKYPRMALITPFLDLHRRKLHVTTTGGASISIDLDDEEGYQGEDDGEGVGIKVCSDTILPRAHKSEALRQMLSEHLGIPCTLAKQNSNTSRHSKLSGGGNGDKIPLIFSNESPFLLINSASVDRVSSWMAPPAVATKPEFDEKMEERASDSGYSSSHEPEQVEKAHASSFRANFVISPKHQDSDQAWTEDTAVRFQLGSHTFAVLGQCRRCQMVCIDQKTGEVKPKTFQTLAKHRRNDRGRIIFGSHLAWMPDLSERCTMSTAQAAANEVWVGMEVKVSH